MKYALIGNGKTGQVIQNMIPAEDIIAVCNIDNPVTKEKLQGADVGIVFVPGNAIADIMPVLLEAKIPMVVGTTGYVWPSDLDEKLKKQKTPWIIGQNFSIALNVMRYFSEKIKESMNALRPGKLKLGILEKHHIHKLDAPSGTALYLAKALDFPAADIEAIREGEIKGIHTISYNWPCDRLLLTHEAMDRAAFAEGVILACQHATKMTAGVHWFQELTDELIESRGK